jgi:hypothetical protein
MGNLHSHVPSTDAQLVQMGVGCSWISILTVKVISWVNIQLCVIGLVINCVVVWVWNSETSYHPTTFFFKALAVTDNIARVWLLVRVFLVKFKVTGVWQDLVSGLVYGHACASMYLIMMLALVRFLFMFTTLETYRRLVTPSRVRWSLACIVPANNALEMGMRAHGWCNGWYEWQHSTLLAVLRVLIVSVPVTLQVVMMLMILARVYHPVWSASVSVSVLKMDLASSPHPSPRTLRKPCTPGLDLARSTAGLAASSSSRQSCFSDKVRKVALRKFRQVTFTVLVMCLNAIIMGPASALALRPFSTDSSLHQYRPLAVSLVTMVYLVTSSFNMLFYVAFLHRFRRLLKKKFQCQHQVQFPASQSSRASSRRIHAKPRVWPSQEAGDVH